jgi:predicted Zn-dependent protease
MLSTRDLVPLTLAAALVGGIAVITVQTRQERAQRVGATQQGQPLSAPEDGMTAAEEGGTPEPAPVDPGVIATLPLRGIALPAPVRDVAAIQRTLAEGSAGTYIGDILAAADSQLVRWPDRTVTALRVWVQSSAAVPHWDTGNPRMVREVLGEWSAAGFPLRFLYVVDSANADMHVMFTRSLPGRQIGLTSRLRDRNGWIVAAEVLIATEDAKGDAFPAYLVAAIARHEIGHALGLDHTRDATAVMFPESRTTTIGAADRATLHLLYTLPPGSVR